MPEPLPLSAVNHISHVTHHLEQSTAFYRDVLGFRQIGRPDFGFPGAWLFNYGVQIHLIAATDDAHSDAAGEISIRADHVAFQTHDTDAVQALLQEHGVPFRTNFVEDVKVTQIFFHDPDGNHVEVGNYPPVRE